MGDAVRVVIVGGGFGGFSQQLGLLVIRMTQLVSALPNLSVCG
jgi:hypothetical protein